MFNLTPQTCTLRENSVKLKDFLRSQKVPLHERDLVPLVFVEDLEGGVGPEAAAVFPSHVGKGFAKDLTGLSPIVLATRLA
mmetsp:Transcript_17055/g.26410  ORF Transcript_17055/g.26410 Transcript_17055/m.26410 type:complete len:81 (-) Transcript_17055:57-299(-)